MCLCVCACMNHNRSHLLLMHRIFIGILITFMFDDSSCHFFHHAHSHCRWHNVLMVYPSVSIYMQQRAMQMYSEIAWRHISSDVHFISCISFGLIRLKSHTFGIRKSLANVPYYIILWFVRQMSASIEKWHNCNSTEVERPVSTDISSMLSLRDRFISLLMNAQMIHQLFIAIELVQHSSDKVFSSISMFLSISFPVVVVVRGSNHPKHTLGSAIMKFQTCAVFLYQVHMINRMYF